MEFGMKHQLNLSVLFLFHFQVSMLFLFQVGTMPWTKKLEQKFLSTCYWWSFMDASYTSSPVSEGKLNRIQTHSYQTLDSCLFRYWGEYEDSSTSTNKLLPAYLATWMPEGTPTVSRLITSNSNLPKSWHQAHWQVAGTYSSPVPTGRKEGMGRVLGVVPKCPQPWFFSSNI